MDSESTTLTRDLFYSTIEYNSSKVVNYDCDTVMIGITYLDYRITTVEFPYVHIYFDNTNNEWWKDLK